MTDKKKKLRFADRVTRVTMTQFRLKPGTWILVLLLKQKRKTVSSFGFNIVLTHKGAEVYELVVRHSCKLLKSDKPRNQE